MDNNSKTFRLRLAQIHGIASSNPIDEARVNIGTEKYPYMVRSSQRLPKKEGDATHHVPGYNPSKDGTIVHQGEIYTSTGKTGKSMKDKTERHEFSSNDTAHRVWIDAKGHITND